MKEQRLKEADETCVTMTRARRDPEPGSSVTPLGQYRTTAGSLDRMDAAMRDPVNLSRRDVEKVRGVRPRRSS